MTCMACQAPEADIPLVIAVGERRESRTLCASCAGSSETVWRHLLMTVQVFAPKGDIGPSVHQALSQAHQNAEAARTLQAAFDPRSWMPKSPLPD